MLQRLTETVLGQKEKHRRTAKRARPTIWPAAGFSFPWAKSVDATRSMDSRSWCMNSCMRARVPTTTDLGVLTREVSQWNS